MLEAGFTGLELYLHGFSLIRMTGDKPVDNVDRRVAGAAEI
jgi:hypothetical protein